MKYEYHESYKHKLAKELLFGWLTNYEKDEGYCPKLPFGWRTGNYGVFIELPFYSTSHVYYFEESKGLRCHDDGCINGSGAKVDFHSQKEIFNPAIDRGKLLFVPDITIFHKGEAKILVEVVHKSPVTEEKLSRISNFFKDHTLELWEIEAENILCQTNKHCNLEFSLIMDTWSYGWRGNAVSYSKYLSKRRNEELTNNF